MTAEKLKKNAYLGILIFSLEIFQVMLGNTVKNLSDPVKCFKNKHSFHVFPLEKEITSISHQ